MNLASLRQMGVLKGLYPAGGWLLGDCQLKANLRQLSNQMPLHQVCKLSGQFSTQGIYFTLNQTTCKLQDQTCSLVLEDEGLMFKNLLAKIGTGNVVLQGKLRNLWHFLWDRQAPLYVTAKLYADYLDLDALLSADSQAIQDPGKHFTISPYWVAELVCDIHELRYKRFHSKQIQGKLTIKDQKVSSEHLGVSFAGGKATLNGFVDTHADSLHLYSLVKLQGLQLDRLFDSFNNFGQSLLREEHLEGRIFGDVVLHIQADKQWHINWDTFTANLAIQVHQGVLRNFAPMQRLTEYVAAEHLSHLRFSPLKNTIQVKNKTIHIPPMDIDSNITPMQLSGTHTFDGKLAYNLVIPLANFKRKEIFQEIENIGEERLAGLNLHLKLVGDIHDYQVIYDTEALKAGLKVDLGKQGKALKEIFQGQYVDKKKVKELATDEYFDFD